MDEGQTPLALGEDEFAGAVAAIPSFDHGAVKGAVQRLQEGAVGFGIGNGRGRKCRDGGKDGNERSPGQKPFRLPVPTMGTDTP